MVEISYRTYSEQADLAGKSVAEAREQYKPVFDISDKAKAYLSGERAKAILSGKPVKKDLEPETILEEDDKLSFAQKSRKGLILVGAFLLALTVTGSTFAFGALTHTVTATVTPKDDFVGVDVGADAISWTAFGGLAGTIAEKTQVFEITPADTFTGDFVVQLYLTNVEEVSEVYRALGMRFSIVNGSGNTLIESVTGVPAVGFLSLQNPICEIEVVTTGTPDGIEVIDVKLLGGFYKANRYGGGWTADAEDPDIFCQILQKGAP